MRFCFTIKKEKNYIFYNYYYTYVLFQVISLLFPENREIIVFLRKIPKISISLLSNN